MSCCNKPANYRGVPCKYCGTWVNEANPRSSLKHYQECKKRKAAFKKMNKEFFKSDEGKKLIKYFEENPIGGKQKK